MEHHGRVVRCIDVSHKMKSRAFGTANLALHQAVVAPLHVTRSERASVVKLDPATQVKDVGERIGNVPAGGDSRRSIEVFIARKEIIEDESVNSLGLCVEANPRVKIGGTAFDDHHQRVGIRILRAGKQRQQSHGTQTCTQRCKREFHVMYMRFYPVSLAAWPRWLMAHSTAADARSHTLAEQR